LLGKKDWRGTRVPSKRDSSRRNRAGLAVDAVLFDMDGTLIDESASYREAIRLTAEHVLGTPVSDFEVEAIKALPGFNNDWDATWALVSGRRGGEIEAVTDAERVSDVYRAMQDVFQTYYLGDRFWHEVSGRPAPFAWNQPLIARETALVERTTLEALEQFALGIATSRPRLEALLAIEQHDLEPFFPPERVIAAEDADFEKPHPAPLLLLAERLSARRPVYVGDTINDALAAAAAGMPFIQVGPDAPGDSVPIFEHLDSVNELTAVCRAEGSVSL
jgi:HAD superfamily hydrolase (TIGR01548 family)